MRILLLAVLAASIAAITLHLIKMRDIGDHRTPTTYVVYINQGDRVLQIKCKRRIGPTYLTDCDDSRVSTIINPINVLEIKE